MKIKSILYLTVVILALFISCKNNVTNSDDETNLNITSTPIENIFHNEEYVYEIITESNQGEIIFSINTLPSWLIFNQQTNTLTGIATGDNLGSHSVNISIRDNVETVNHIFDIEVNLRQVSGGPWIGHFPHDWYHDGQPLIGENSIIYSDAASDEVKQDISDRVESAFIDIKQQCGITSNDVFTYLSDNHKIDIYANRLNTEYLGGFAYNAGAIVISLDSPYFRPNEGWCVNEIEHEMMHIMEYLMEGGRRLILSEVWFREGIADYYAGNDLITTKQDMENWLVSRSRLPGGGNPIKIHVWEDFPTEVANVHGQGLWYPMFELAVRYLMDVNGQGKSMEDAKNLFIDMDVNEKPFPLAFEQIMGISLQYFEDNFFQLMDNYLYD